MRTLITGGAGFIGSHLAERLLRSGATVSVIDDLSTGSLSNIAHLVDNPSFSHITDTVFNLPVITKLVESCDVVYHLAAAVGVRFIVDSPVRTIETNVHGTEVVLKAAAKNKTRTIIASTSEVYGKSTQFPFKEDADLVLGPSTKSRWSYACSKALDEFLGLAYWNEQEVPVTIVRLFNTVGPRQTGRYGMVVPTLVRQALLGQPITVFGDGEQRRCFGYVGDVVEALFRLPQLDSSVGEVINVGNDQEITINQLAALIKQIIGSKSEIAHVPYDQAYGPGFEDMFRRIPCLDKLERIVGQRPTTSIEKILELVIAECRQTLPTKSRRTASSG